MDVRERMAQETSEDVLRLAISELQGHNAQLARQQDTLIQENGAIRDRMVALEVACEQAVAQWRRRAEESLGTQLRMAGEISRLEMSRLEMSRPLVSESDVTYRDALNEQDTMIRQKDAYIAHLESLLQGNPVSLLGAWLTLQRVRRNR